ncbi:MAG TPA: DUF4157 domain-containing protein [Kofleriaceae bacterium]|jgi:hypothetical protein
MKREHRPQLAYDDRDAEREAKRKPRPVPGKRTLVEHEAERAQLAWPSDSFIARGGAAARPAADRAVAEADTSHGQRVPSHIARAFGAAGVDVSDVRLHASESSARAARSISARAYALGRDVHFGAGQLAPGTRSGDYLIAHEVAHTIQQRGTSGAAPQLSSLLGASSDAAEREADHAADLVLAGGGRLPAMTARPQLARWADDLSARAVDRIVAHASPDALLHLRTALRDAEGCGDAMAPLDIPGYAGYVAHEDLRPLLDHVQRRITETAPPRPMGSDAIAPGLPGHGPRPTGAASLQSVRDSDIRLNEYVAPAQQLSQRVLADVERGDRTLLEGVEEARLGRAAIRAHVRSRISTMASRVSASVERDSPTLEQLLHHNSLRVLQADPATARQRFPNLGRIAAGDAATEAAIGEIMHSPQVLRRAIEGAGRTNGFMNRMARRTRVLGPIMVGVQLGTMAWNVANAEDGERLWTTGHELSGFAGGTIGGLAGSLAVAAIAATVVGLPAGAAIMLELVVVGGGSVVGAEEGQALWDRTLSPEEIDDFLEWMPTVLRQTLRGLAGGAGSTTAAIGRDRAERSEAGIPGASEMDHSPIPELEPDRRAPSSGGEFAPSPDSQSCRPT